MDPRWRKRWRIERERGQRRLVRTDRVRVHVEQLVAAGMSKRSIATAAGVSATTVVRVLDGHYTAMQRRTASQLLSVTGPASVLAAVDDTDETFVPALGARRRIRALLALGWTHQQLYSASGIRTAVALHQAGEWVTARKFRAIDRLYEQLSMTPGPSAATRARARRLGYPPPLAWDDVDDPSAVPDVGVPVRGIDLSEVDWLLTQGHTLDQAAVRLGVTRSAVEHARSRAQVSANKNTTDRISA